jgi:hypothetical protein
MSRRPNARLVKLHRSYTVEEISSLFGIHKNTVRTWIKQGLQPIDRRRPMLVYGRVLIRFLHNRHARSKRPCPPGHMYCLKCRSPKRPAGGMADYLSITATFGNLRALCPDCGTFMHRRAAVAQLRIIGPDWDIAFPQRPARLGESAAACVNSDFKPEAQFNADA